MEVIAYQFLKLVINFCEKKAQKKEKKKRNSEVIKRIMPQRRPFSTIEVCRP